MAQTPDPYEPRTGLRPGAMARGEEVRATAAAAWAQGKPPTADYDQEQEWVKRLLEDAVDANLGQGPT